MRTFDPRPEDRETIVIPSFEQRSADAPIVVDWVARLAALATLFLFYIAAGAHGFVDLIVFGADEGGVVMGIGLLSRTVWPVAYVLLFGLMIYSWPLMLHELALNWWALLFPLVALLSTLWSLDASVTANAAVRLLVSAMFAVYIGAVFPPYQIARLLVLVLLPSVALSVVVGLAGLDFTIMHDGTIRGLFWHKNQFGNRSLFLLAAALTLLAPGERRWLAISGIVAALLGLAMARSSTSILAAVAILLGPFFVVLRGEPEKIALRLAIAGCLAVAVVTVGLIVGIDPIDATLGLLGKDATLTGRVMLWDAAMSQIAERPLLGAGFAAFWATAIDWQTYLVMNVMGNIGHFHNTFLEVGVQLGFLGLAAAIFTALVYSYWAIAYLRFGPSRSALWPTLLGAAAFVPTFAEYELFLQHNLTHILVVAVIVAARRELGR